MDGNKYKIKSRDCMKTVDVIFVSDELVGSTIVSKKEYERILRQKIKAEAEKVEQSKNLEEKNEENHENIKSTLKRKTNHVDSEVKNKQTKYVDDVELALAALENDDIEKMDVMQPSTLFDEGDVSAKKICNFGNTITPIKIQKSNNETPNESKGDKTPSMGKHKERNQTSLLIDPNQTPLTVRKKVIRDIKQIQKILENSDNDDDDDDNDFTGSDSDSSFKASDDSHSGSDNKNKNSNKKSSKTQKVSSTKSSKSFFENYCDLQSNKKSNYSLNTLKNLKTSKLTQEKFDELVENFETSQSHKTRLKALLNEIMDLFDKWEFVLSQNFNLLLYGLGSKREIIGKFVERIADTSPVIVVNGFFPSISVREILDKLCEILRIDEDSDVEALDAIEGKIKNYDLNVYIAINNIDGVMLRNKTVQGILSHLGKIEQIHIIASIDHINAPLIWDMKKSGEFNWIWFDATTYLNYKEEIIYEGNLMLQNSGKATLSSLRHVFNALTKNSQEIFLIMIKNQLESGKNKTGMSFRELYEECRRELLISTDVALRSQLKEFIDHAILKQKKSADGEDQFVITMDANILKQFLEEKEANQ